MKDESDNDKSRNREEINMISPRVQLVPMVMKA